MPDTASRGIDTRDALIKTATQVFAQQGYHGVSTRAIATAAGVNQALIGYHFGNKEGLYLAVFEAIGQSLGQHLSPLGQKLRQVVDDAPANLDRPARLALYLPLLDNLCNVMSELLLSPQTEYWAQLILREQQNPSQAFELLFERLMQPMLGALTRLLAELRGDLDAKGHAMLAISLLGQILVWRFAREAVARHMGWQQQPDLAAIQHLLHQNIRLLVKGEL